MTSIRQIEVRWERPLRGSGHTDALAKGSHSIFICRAVLDYRLAGKLMVSQLATSAKLSEQIRIVPSWLSGRSGPGGIRMSGLGIRATSEGVLAVFIAAAWWWAVRQRGEHVGWRYKAAAAGLLLPTLAVVIQLILIGVEAHFGSLAALDDASVRSSLSPLLAGLWLCSFFSTGLLAFCGLVLTIIGKGSLRLPGAVSSFLVLGGFLMNLVLAVNSFH